MTDDIDQAEAVVKKILGGYVLPSETPIYDELEKQCKYDALDAISELGEEDG